MVGSSSSPGSGPGAGPGRGARVAGGAALATYLGHVSPTSTYWYLTASPELLDLVNDRIEAHRQGRTA